MNSSASYNQITEQTRLEKRADVFVVVIQESDDANRIAQLLENEAGNIAEHNTMVYVFNISGQDFIIPAGLSSDNVKDVKILSPDELIDMIKLILLGFLNNKVRNENKCQTILSSSGVLIGEDFSNLDLKGENLQHKNLSKVELTNTNLTGANLTGANLTSFNTQKMLAVIF